MSLSLNEIEATAKRAARGAGYTWGHAEEAGKATRWLCAQGLDGVWALASLLHQNLAHAPEKHAPCISGDTWTGTDVLCPLATGCALSDSAEVLRAAPVTLTNVNAPALLLPFASNAARILNSGVSITIDGAEAQTDGLTLHLTGAIPDQAQSVTVRLAEVAPPTQRQQSRATPDPAAWSVLTRFAHRTYAPATEESRLRGAGAGLSDND
ncbi:hypothetical protein RUESEDTHA_02908 [Ruegeria sp. THAF57]|uniref:DUF3726 domain-containing protein n=1 Tax=Ruegeria sp. THAF57 TaxID=2744555 RepID=UPI0015DDA29C|nr:DUF3726 domain-containing protein [Ruegeria sp. THAF57]CAD0186003.1 hypothetical protein RUESEDTHA_02908 [Ruegeria sp. THAF57]